ncbi:MULTISPECIES: hypothetical protein [Pseudobacillus]
MDLLLIVGTAGFVGLVILCFAQAEINRIKKEAYKQGLREGRSSRWERSK